MYRVGDRVVVRPDLRRGVRYYMDNKDDWNSATEEMCAMAGKTVTIERTSAGQYSVTGSVWHWTDEMFYGPEGDGFDASCAGDLAALFS